MIESNKPTNINTMKVRESIMGEMWMGIWIFSFIGLFIIAVAIYDYLDKKKRNQEIKLWKYFVVVLIGLGLMFPILSGIILWLLGLPL